MLKNDKKKRYLKMLIIINWFTLLKEVNHLFNLTIKKLSIKGSTLKGFFLNLAIN